ncbi:hypothetical protein BC828DRAFT_384367 [Blastocladiella britannica]|nr:hypothetical protein BC828DRAFT_384367 [Blastocladiella britannica]
MPHGRGRHPSRPRLDHRTRCRRRLASTSLTTNLSLRQLGTAVAMVLVAVLVIHGPVPVIAQSVDPPPSTTVSASSTTMPSTSVSSLSSISSPSPSSSPEITTTGPQIQQRQCRTSLRSSICAYARLPLPVPPPILGDADMLKAITHIDTPIPADVLHHEYDHGHGHRSGPPSSSSPSPPESTPDTFLKRRAPLGSPDDGVDRNGSPGSSPQHGNTVSPPPTTPNGTLDGSGGGGGGLFGFPNNRGWGTPGPDNRGFLVRGMFAADGTTAVNETTIDAAVSDILGRIPRALISRGVPLSGIEQSALELRYAHSLACASVAFAINNMTMVARTVTSAPSSSSTASTVIAASVVTDSDEACGRISPDTALTLCAAFAVSFHDAVLAACDMRQGPPSRFSIAQAVHDVFPNLCPPEFMLHERIVMTMSNTLTAVTTARIEHEPVPAARSMFGRSGRKLDFNNILRGLIPQIMTTGTVASSIVTTEWDGCGLYAPWYGALVSTLAPPVNSSSTTDLTPDAHDAAFAGADLAGLCRYGCPTAACAPSFPWLLLIGGILAVVVVAVACMPWSNRSDGMPLHERIVFLVMYWWLWLEARSRRRRRRRRERNNDRAEDDELAAAASTAAAAPAAAKSFRRDGSAGSRRKGERERKSSLASSTAGTSPAPRNRTRRTPPSPGHPPAGGTGDGSEPGRRKRTTSLSSSSLMAETAAARSGSSATHRRAGYASGSPAVDADIIVAPHIPYHGGSNGGESTYVASPYSGDLAASEYDGVDLGDPGSIVAWDGTGDYPEYAVSLASTDVYSSQQSTDVVVPYASHQHQSVSAAGDAETGAMHEYASLSPSAQSAWPPFPMHGDYSPILLPSPMTPSPMTPSPIAPLPGIGPDFDEYDGHGGLYPSTHHPHRHHLTVAESIPPHSAAAPPVVTPAPVELPAPTRAPMRRGSSYFLPVQQQQPPPPPTSNHGIAARRHAAQFAAGGEHSYGGSSGLSLTGETGTPVTPVLGSSDGAAIVGSGLPGLALRAVMDVFGEPRVVLHPYAAAQEDELVLDVGDLIHVTKVMDNGWAEGINLTQLSEGMFPMVCTATQSTVHLCSVLLESFSDQAIPQALAASRQAPSTPDAAIAAAGDGGEVTSASAASPADLFWDGPALTAATASAPAPTDGGGGGGDPSPPISPLPTSLYAGDQWPMRRAALDGARRQSMPPSHHQHQQLPAAAATAPVTREFVDPAQQLAMALEGWRRASGRTTLSRGNSAASDLNHMAPEGGEAGEAAVATRYEYMDRNDGIDAYRQGLPAAAAMFFPWTVAVAVAAAEE